MMTKRSMSQGGVAYMPPTEPEARRRTRDVSEALAQSRTLGNSEKRDFDDIAAQAAADLLGVSRPTLVKLLEEGHIPFTKVGRHRRVMLDDLQQYAERRHREHIAMFDELAAEENPALTIDNPLIRR